EQFDHCDSNHQHRDRYRIVIEPMPFLYIHDTPPCSSNSTAYAHMGRTVSLRLAISAFRVLPFEDYSIDLSFTVTVLHHVTDAAMREALVKDICRVTRDTVVIMEDIGQCEQLGGGGSFIGRTVAAYENLFTKHGFQLRETRFLNTKVSRRWYDFSWRAYRRV